MATTYQRIKPGTAKTIKSSAGDATITLASLANGNGTSTGARQSTTLDLGASWAQWWRVDTEFELAPTPTANAVIGIHGSFSNATGSGVGSTAGTDSAYTGYSYYIDVSLNQLEVLGFHVCTSQATSTVQKCNAGRFFPLGRYLNVVVNNKSGAAFHTSDANCLLRLTPLDGVQEDT
jgi:hypothetical protein